MGGFQWFLGLYTNGGAIDISSLASLAFTVRSYAAFASFKRTSVTRQPAAHSSPDSNDSRGYLSIYLFLDIDNLPKRRSIHLCYRLLITNQRDSAQSVCKGAWSLGAGLLCPLAELLCRISCDVPDQGRTGLGRPQGHRGSQDHGGEWLHRATVPFSYYRGGSFQHACPVECVMHVRYWWHTKRLHGGPVSAPCTPFLTCLQLPLSARSHSLATWACPVALTSFN